VMAAVVSCVLFCLNSELLQSLQQRSVSGKDQPSLLLNLIVCHMGFLVFAPRYLLWDREEGACSLGSGIGSCPRFAALIFAVLLMGYNYAFLQSANFLAAGTTNAVFQSSLAMVYVASIILFRQPFTMPGLMGVVLALGGALLASNSFGVTATHTVVPVHHAAIGAILACIAAVGYTVYQVLFKFMFGHLKNNIQFLAFICAWIGVWHLVLAPPMLLLAHKSGFELLHVPHGAVAISGTVASAIIASTVNGLYLCIVMWGNPMLLPCISALSVPLTVMLDLFLHQVVPGHIEIIGHALVVASVAILVNNERVTSKLSTAEL